MHKAVPIILLFMTAVLASAADQDAVLERYRRVMAGSDYQAKREAVTSLAALPDDDRAYPALIQALGDRQAKEAAIRALRQRSGLQPARSRGGNTGYPGYPAADTPSAWSTWNQARRQEQQTQAAVEEARSLALAAQAEAKETGAEDPAGDADDQAEADAGPSGDDEAQEDGRPPPRSSVPAERLGPPDRIFFKDGSILIGHVTVQRRDLTGQLTSVHVVHTGGGGEEDIDAELISRIEEDIRQ
ncbi:MAG: hypothetical protein ACOCXJ_02550 [Planctomycetota bacterium]